MATKLNGWTKWILAVVAVVMLWIAGAGSLMSIGAERDQIEANKKINEKQENDINILKTDTAVIKNTTKQMAVEVKDMQVDIKSILRKLP